VRPDRWQERDRGGSRPFAFAPDRVLVAPIPEKRVLALERLAALQMRSAYAVHAIPGRERADLQPPGSQNRVCSGLDGSEFVRRARNYGKRFGLPVRFDPAVGKGSHGMLYLGDRRPIVKRSELGTQLLAAMLEQLGVDKREL